MSSVMRFDEWQDSEGNPVFNGAGGVSPGGLIAVKSALKTNADVFSSVAAGGNVAVTGLSITHEVADPSNKLIISAFFGIAASQAQRGQCGIAVHDGTGLIGVGDAAGSRTSLTAGLKTSSASASLIVTNPSATFVHTPGAGSKTYTVRAVNFDTAIRDLFINRTIDNTDAASDARGVSSLVIQEVAV